MRSLSLVIACALIACSSVPDAPTAIDYNHEACSHCHMLIGDPRYAAQLVTADGDVVDFDDPGCLIAYLAQAHPATRHVWFRDAQADRWLTAEQVSFAPAAETPMGWGLAATRGGPITYAQAQAQVAARAAQVTP
jgi:copper chaperone NosL